MLWGLAWVWLRSYSITNTDYLKIMEAKVKIIMMILVSTAGSSDSASTCRPASVLWGGTVVLLLSESKLSQHPSKEAHRHLHLPPPAFSQWQLHSSYTNLSVVSSSSHPHHQGTRTWRHSHLQSWDRGVNPGPGVKTSGPAPHSLTSTPL